MRSLIEAKQWLRTKFEKGADCPCCGQFVKLYKRKLNSSMAYVLVLLSRVRGYVHVPSFINEQVSDAKIAAAVRGDWAKLEHWGLIEPELGVRDDGSKRTGRWRITAHGRNFVAGNTHTHSHVFIFNGKRVAWDGDTQLIFIHDALGDRFNYRELMSATPEVRNGTR